MKGKLKEETKTELDVNLYAGFKVLTKECCKVWENGQCAANEKPCKNRNDYVFFDSFHPTEAANIITAMSSYNASNPVFTYPMDIYHLVHS